MTVIYQWDDNDLFHSRRSLAKERCALSGRPLKPPFMVWHNFLHGHDRHLYINASSLGDLALCGMPLLHDLVELMHAAYRLNTPHALHRQRQVRRLLAALPKRNDDRRPPYGLTPTE